jgi:hypothetical protein
MKCLIAALLFGAVAASAALAAPTVALHLHTVSNHAHLISGGQALVRIEVPDEIDHARVRVELDGVDVTERFRAVPGEGALLGLVTGLRIGENRLAAGVPGGAVAASLTIVNHTSAGPIVSGPHVQPFICQAERFLLPDGTSPKVLDADCAIETTVHYVYVPAGEREFKPLPGGRSLPADVAMTTTVNGARVPFVVRVETGTLNRGIYQNAVLHDPTSEAAPDPFTRLRGWNGRLIGLHGSGCTGGWYVQGAAQGGNLLDPERLGEGYAIFINTLNHPSNSCNPVLAAEATMMGKEHFIETFGVPDFAVATGCSGGAYTSLQVADLMPGLFDGVHVSCTYPDALSIALAGLDARLLANYFLNGNPAGFTEAQMVAVSGHANARAWYDLALQAARTDPIPGREERIPASPIGGPYRSGVFHADVPEALRYHPERNSGGARPTVFDWARNVYGVDPETGFARRPFDNEGVQYGLAALNAGSISADQFLDLNERIGGYDHDSNYAATRSVGDVGAIERAHRSGTSLSGGGGLAAIPVFDWSNIYDEENFYHYQWFHFAVRERMREQNGHIHNHVMWRGGPPITQRSGALNEMAAAQSWDVFIDWVAAYTADRSGAPQLERVLKHKPAAAGDACYGVGEVPELIYETQTLGVTPDTRCNALWPSWSFPRKEAGGPLHANNLKCELRPLDPGDYRGGFTESEWRRLREIFPDGVCDWERPGAGFRSVEPWWSLGPGTD